jgi:excisionase family DNA binding protein
MAKKKVQNAQADARNPGSAIIGAKWAARSSFTVPEAAEILGVSPWSAYQAAGKGEIPVVQIGKRKIVPRAALEKLLGA